MQTYDACIADMKTNTYLGEFEYAVLLAVLQVEGAYAVPIRRILEERTGRPVARGALYTALERLERKGYLRSTMSDPTPERGGRSKRHYSLRPAGVAALRRSRELLDRMWRGLSEKALKP